MTVWEFILRILAMDACLIVCSVGTFLLLVLVVLGPTVAGPQTISIARVILVIAILAILGHFAAVPATTNDQTGTNQNTIMQTCPSCGATWSSAYCGDCGTKIPLE